MLSCGALAVFRLSARADLAAGTRFRSSSTVYGTAAETWLESVLSCPLLLTDVTT
jgi:hypothetical protein